MELITNEDVKRLLPTVPYINEPVIQDPDSIRNLLVLLGIRSRRQLEEFVKAKDVFDFLADVYVKELDRKPSETPLDPTAVVIWGVILFMRGLGEDIKREILRKIRESPEYKQKHPK